MFYIETVLLIYNNHTYPIHMECKNVESYSVYKHEPLKTTLSLMINASCTLMKFISPFISILEVNVKTTDSEGSSE